MGVSILCPLVFVFFHAHTLDQLVFLSLCTFRALGGALLAPRRDCRTYVVVSWLRICGNAFSFSQHTLSVTCYAAFQEKKNVQRESMSPLYSPANMFTTRSSLRSSNVGVRGMGGKDDYSPIVNNSMAKPMMWSSRFLTASHTVAMVSMSSLCIRNTRRWKSLSRVVIWWGTWLLLVRFLGSI